MVTSLPELLRVYPQLKISQKIKKQK